METIFLYVDAVLRARDKLLTANIRVVGYDFYPNGAGALRIYDDDRERAVTALTANAIPVVTESPAPSYPFLAIWPSQK